MSEIIIIGKGPGWKDAPLEGNTWGVNNLCLRRDVKVIFNMHKEIPFKVKQAIDSYAIKNKIPLISLQKQNNVSTSVKFPLEKMHTEYFTNSIAYMIAYAIYKKAIIIDLYGCFLGTKSEYAFQKPCIEYWIGYARGKGIKVNIYEPTSLMRISDGYLYGYNKVQKKF